MLRQSIRVETHPHVILRQDLWSRLHSGAVDQFPRPRWRPPPVVAFVSTSTVSNIIGGEKELFTRRPTFLEKDDISPPRCATCIRPGPGVLSNVASSSTPTELQATSRSLESHQLRNIDLVKGDGGLQSFTIIDVHPRLRHLAAAP